MKLREIIIVEDEGASVATTSADIATVAYPLFVRGKTPKEKRKNARAAVGQKYVPGVEGIGTGVFESDNPEDTVNMDVPLLIRSLEHAREEIQSDVQLHSFVERLLALGKNGQRVLSMSDYASLVEGALRQVEAHVLGHDNVIYRLDRENPMTDTEVAVLGGAGRYTLKALRDKARREAAKLAQDLSVEHGGAFRDAAYNIKQLTNTINTIVAAYNELKRIRSKGGRGARGITDEDTNFIRECIRVVEQASQNYRLLEGVAVEPDSTGYAPDLLSNPKFTVVVNTPGDLDWYKLGTHWNDRVVDPHEFGQSDSDTVMIAFGKSDFQDMIKKLDAMGMTYKVIGGSDAQPEIHDKV